jgi:hypothetical protein
MKAWFIHFLRMATLAPDLHALSKAEHLEDDGYDMDPLPYPPGFSLIPRFPSRCGDMVLNVSNDEPIVEGETDEQWQLHELRNIGRAKCRHLEAEEEEYQRDPDQEI